MTWFKRCVYSSKRTHAESCYNYISFSFPPTWNKSTLRRHWCEQQTENQDEEFFNNLVGNFPKKVTKKLQDFALHSDDIWGVSQIDSSLILKDHTEITVKITIGDREEKENIQTESYLKGKTSLGGQTKYKQAVYECAEHALGTRLKFVRAMKPNAEKKVCKFTLITCSITCSGT